MPGPVSCNNRGIDDTTVVIRPGIAQISQIVSWNRWRSYPTASSSEKSSYTSTSRIRDTLRVCVQAKSCVNDF
jgi:hypothetical protein